MLEFIPTDAKLVGDTIAATADAVRDAGQKASVVLADAGKEAYETGSAAHASIVRQVTAQPMAAIAAAGAIGLLAGLLLWRGREPTQRR